MMLAPMTDRRFSESVESTVIISNWRDFAIQKSVSDQSESGLRTRLFESRRVKGALLVGLVAAGCLLVAGFFFFGTQGLKTRSQAVQSGMTRAEVEAIVGEPYLVMPRDHGRGTALVWVDQFWQVEVRLDADDRAELVICSTSDSAYRRSQRFLKSMLP